MVDAVYMNTMVTSDPTRINEGISVYPRASNPMVDVMYTNANFTEGGNHSMTMDNLQQSLPYKVGMFGRINPRPATVYKMEDYLPLSRMKYKDPSVSINPGLPDGFVVNFENTIDKAQIKADLVSKVKYYDVRPNKSFRMDQMVYIKPTNEIRAHSLNLSGVAKKNLAPYNTVGLGDTHDTRSVNAQLREPMLIDAGAGQDLTLFNSSSIGDSFDNYSTNFNIKESQPAINVTSNSRYDVGAEQLFQYEQVDMKRNIPSHSINTNYTSSNTRYGERMYDNKVNLSRISNFGQFMRF